MKPFHPDDSGMIPRDPKKGGNGGGNGGGGLMNAFLPGQRGLLASQLAQGFGGKPSAFSEQLRMMYQPTFNPSGFRIGNGGGGGGNNQPGPVTPDTTGLIGPDGRPLSPQQMAMYRLASMRMGGL